MRNKRFVAEHRGGALTKDQHRKLILWACKCVENVVARAAGHAVATAHMADHSLRAAEYALKAVKLAGKSIDSERKFQDIHLSPDIAEFVLSARNKQNTN